MVFGGAPKDYQIWRMANAHPLTKGWAVHEFGFFTDNLCNIRAPVQSVTASGYVDELSPILAVDGEVHALQNLLKNLV